MKKNNAFRLGDVRGVYPDEIDVDFATQFAFGFAHHFGLKKNIAIGRDMRDSSVLLQDGLNKGFTQSGINVINLGLCTTELGYFASSMPDIEAVIIVTASHNAAHYNGFKCVLQGGVGIHFENGLQQVMSLMQHGEQNLASKKGKVSSRDYHAQYIEFLKARFDLQDTNIGTIALNGLNGTASTLAADIANEFELPVSWFRKEPGPIPEDGADPGHPILRQEMSDFMQEGAYSLGVAWDGDCDRCVFFDSGGRHIPAYYMVGLLADQILSQKGPGAIVYDTKACWNLMEVIQRHGAKGVPSKTGHAFMKENMRQSNALYGGELSSHHYFGDFFHCDSGMYAWLKTVELIAELDRPIGELVADRRASFQCTRELSLKLNDMAKAEAYLRKHYTPKAKTVDNQDGCAFDMGAWRFSFRASKTEPVVRVNFESSSGNILEPAAEVLHALEPFGVETENWLSGLSVD